MNESNAFKRLLDVVGALQQRITQLERRVLTLEEHGDPERGPRIGG